MIEIKNIDQSEALRYLGYGSNKPSETIQNLINECETQLLKVIEPRFLYRTFRATKTDSEISLENCKLVLTGKDIFAHLDGCDSVVLMCATISAGVDKLIRVTQISDMTKALIMDSLASVAVEQICNKVDIEIKAEHSTQYQTWRYSPGYGDLPLSIEKDFLDALNAPKRIGLFANESSILTPRKSVTAIIGLSDNQIPQRKRGCQSCNLRDTCAFRKRGDRCGF